MTYMTRQQQAVLDCIRQRERRCATAAELTEALHRQGQRVGMTTVYRQLERLESQGLLHKILTPEGCYYQYCDRTRHDGGCVLLKCERCGAITHADCSHLGELYAHLAGEHHFLVNTRKTLFYGLCGNCAAQDGEARP